MLPIVGNLVPPRSGGWSKPSEGDGASKHQESGEPYRAESVEKSCIPTRVTTDRDDSRTSEDAGPAAANDQGAQALRPVLQHTPPASYQSGNSEYTTDSGDSSSESWRSADAGSAGSNGKRTWAPPPDLPFRPPAAYQAYAMPFNVTDMPTKLGGDILQRLQSPYANDLVYSEENALTVNLATIQRINLEILRYNLVGKAFRTKYSPILPYTVDLNRNEIHQYVEALRDWDYISECAKRGEGLDPFVVSTKLTLSRDTILDHMSIMERSGMEQRYRDTFSKDMATLGSLPPPIDGGNVDKFGGSRRAKNQKERYTGYLQRTFMAILGGIFLIGPMLVMVLHNTKATSLITTSICAFLFGLVISVSLEKPIEVLSATAAYAAVLVVFVGTNTGGG